MTALPVPVFDEAGEPPAGLANLAINWAPILRRQPQLAVTAGQYLDQISISLSASSVRVADQTLRLFCEFLGAWVRIPKLRIPRAHVVCPGDPDLTMLWSGHVQSDFGPTLLGARHRQGPVPQQHPGLDVSDATGEAVALDGRVVGGQQPPAVPRFDRPLDDEQRRTRAESRDDEVSGPDGDVPTYEQAVTVTQHGEHRGPLDEDDPAAHA